MRRFIAILYWRFGLIDRLIVSEEMVGGEVFGKSGGHFGRNGVEAEDVEIVFEVVELYDAPERILGGTCYEIFIAFAIAFRHGEDAVDDGLGEALVEEVFGGDVGIFYGVVKKCDHLFFVAMATHGHAHRVLEVGSASFVALAGVLGHAYHGGLVEQFCRFFFRHPKYVLYCLANFR